MFTKAWNRLNVSQYRVAVNFKSLVINYLQLTRIAVVCNKNFILKLNFKFTSILLRDVQACFHRCIILLLHFVPLTTVRSISSRFCFDRPWPVTCSRLQTVTARDPFWNYELHKQAWYEVWTIMTNTSCELVLQAVFRSKPTPK